MNVVVFCKKNKFYIKFLKILHQIFWILNLKLHVLPTLKYIAAWKTLRLSITLQLHIDKVLKEYQKRKIVGSLKISNQKSSQHKYFEIKHRSWLPMNLNGTAYCDQFWQTQKCLKNYWLRPNCFLFIFRIQTFTTINSVPLNN